MSECALRCPTVRPGATALVWLSNGYCGCYVVNTGPGAYYRINNPGPDPQLYYDLRCFAGSSSAASSSSSLPVIAASSSSPAPPISIPPSSTPVPQPSSSSTPPLQPSPSPSPAFSGVCGDAGQITTIQAVDTSSNAPSNPYMGLGECFLYCQSKSCPGIMWDSSIQYCYLLKAQASWLYYPQRGSRYLFYDSGCPASTYPSVAGATNGNPGDTTTTTLTTTSTPAAAAAPPSSSTPAAAAPSSSTPVAAQVVASSPAAAAPASSSPVVTPVVSSQPAAVAPSSSSVVSYLPPLRK